MDRQAKNWKAAKGILHDVLRIEPARRQSFLEQTGATVEVRREVESLLAFEAAVPHFMSLSATDFSKDFTSIGSDEEEISLVGQLVGIYEILGEIGCGGMGAVYLAKRADGKFEQRVAVKMLRREYNTERIRRHFRREKEIQARLNHPNIVRLLDAGTTGDGIPFLVMEHIEGVPIDRFCERRNLALDARLKLFNRVCDAVTHAHRNLIVHRDLKPSNILVTEDGEPKLLDFGISKLLDAPNSEERAAVTLLGAMTPEYASPEQISGEPVSTATDVYSLGAVLFKMLTGALPFDWRGKTNGELLKAVTETEPRAPSATSNLESQISDEDWKPTTENRKPNSQLKGDIDNIILKSLAKTPERRYQTVEHFAADIRRYLDGLPVAARPATAAYRAAKFYRRNRIFILAVVFVFLSLIGGIAAAVSQARTANAQAQIASDARAAAVTETEKARAEQARAEKISRFLAKIIAYANPRWYGEGAKMKGEARVIDALLEMGDKIDREFPDHADVRAELHHKFAEAVLGHLLDGRFSPHEAEIARLRMQFHASRALDLRREFYGARHELVAKDLAYYYWTFYVYDWRKQADGARLLAEAIQMMRETNPQNLNLPYMLEAYAGRLLALPDDEVLETACRWRAIPATGGNKRRVSEEISEEIYETYRRAAIPATGENRFQIAESQMREALPIFRLHYQKDNHAIYNNECQLAYALAMQDKWMDFDEHYRICRQEETNAADDSSLPARTILWRIEKVLADKNRQ